MNEATVALSAMTGVLLLSLLGFLIWGIKSGQFTNIEEAKYRIFRSDKENDMPAPGSQAGESQSGGGEDR
jgi:cbb3-type cytochrome oxidase maturation protein